MRRTKKTVTPLQKHVANRPSSMSPNNLPARASLSPPLASSPSVFRLFSAPPSSAGCHPPSPRTTDWRPVLCCPWCPVQCLDVWGFSPPTCVAGGTWLGCGWRGVGDGAPPMILISSMLFAIPARPKTKLSSVLLNPLDHLGGLLCMTPLPFPPFYVQL